MPRYRNPGSNRRARPKGSPKQLSVAATAEKFMADIKPLWPAIQAELKTKNIRAIDALEAAKDSLFGISHDRPLAEAFNTALANATREAEAAKREEREKADAKH